MEAFECFVVAGLLNISSPLFRMAFPEDEHSGVGAFCLGGVFWVLGLVQVLP